jgi:hypothetical protein
MSWQVWLSYLAPLLLWPCDINNLYRFGRHLAFSWELAQISSW